MKTIHLNLAARPYRNYQPVYATLAAMAVVSLLLLVNNVGTAYRYFVNTKETRGEIANVENAARVENQKAQSIENSLKRYDLKSLNTQARYINGTFAERAFSWSELLDDLEDILPGDVRLVSLSPNVDKNGVTMLTLECMSKERDGMVVLLNRLIRNPRFVNPLPRAENTQPNGLHGFTIEVGYRPATAKPAVQQ